MSSGKGIGTSIRIDGEKEFRDAIKAIKTDTGVLNSELGKVTAQYKNNANSVEAVTAKSETYAKICESQKSKIDVLKNALENAKKEYGENSDKVKSWQTQLNNAERDLAKTENSLKEVNKSLKAENAKKFKEAMKDVKEAATSAANGIKEVVSATAKITVAGVTAYTAALTGAVTAAFNLSAAAGVMADDINTLSTQTHVSTEELQKYSYAADLVDVSVETMTKAMAKNVKSMGSSSKAVVAAYSQLGVATKDGLGTADEALRNSNDVFWEAIEALGEIEDETERDSLAMAIFGKSAQNLNPLIATGRDGIEELTKSASELGLILGQDTLDSLNSFNDSIDIMKANVSASSNIIGAAFSDIFKNYTDVIGGSIPILANSLADAIGSGDFTLLTDNLTETLSSIGDLVREHTPMAIATLNGVLTAIGTAISATAPDTFSVVANSVLDGFAGLVGTAIEMLPEQMPIFANGLLDVVTKLIGFVLQTISEQLPVFLEVIGGLVLSVIDSLGDIGDTLTSDTLPKVITQLCDWLSANTGTILTAAVKLFDGLVQGLATNVVLLLQEVIKILPEIERTLAANSWLLIETGLQLLLTLTSGIIEAIPELLARFPEIIMNICDMITEMLPNIAETGGTLLLQLTLGIWSAVPQLLDSLPEIINSIVECLMQLLPVILSAGGDILLTLSTGIIEAMPEMVEALPQIIYGIVEMLMNYMPQMFALGMTLLVELGKGIIDAMPTLVDSLGDGLSNLFDVLGNFISPAVDIGRNIVEGLWNGINNAKDWLTNKISGFFDGVVDNIKDFLGIHSPSKVMQDKVGVFMAQGVGVGFIDEIENVSKQMQDAVSTKFNTVITADLNNQLSGSRGAMYGSSSSHTVNIYQTNTLPKTVSAYEIYRQTKSAVTLSSLGVY